MTQLTIHMSLLLFLINLVSSFSQWIPKIPKECEDKVLCDRKIKNYPKRSLVYRTVEMLTKEGYVIGQDPHPFDPPPPLGPKESELCRSKFIQIIPNAAKESKTNQWRFVINDRREPMQVVSLEICSQESAPCDKLSSRYFKIQPGYNASCVQKYFHKALIGYNETGHVIHFSTTVPMCCACVGRTLQ